MMNPPSSVARVRRADSFCTLRSGEEHPGATGMVPHRVEKVISSKKKGVHTITPLLLDIYK